MKKTVAAIVIGLAAGIGMTGEARAEAGRWASPVGIGIFAPVQFPPIGCDVYGVRLDCVMGWNNNVYGIDVGPVGICSGNFGGLEVGVFNWAGSCAWGLQFGAIANVVGDRSLDVQFAGIANVVHGDGAGFQSALVNYANSFVGFQLGAISWNSAASVGGQLGVVNVDQEEYVGFCGGLLNTTGKFAGFQLGAINLAEEATGLQIGVVNAVNRMHGVQIGAINVIAEGPLPMMVIANASF